MKNLSSNSRDMGQYGYQFENIVFKVNTVQYDKKYSH